jgi:hypothetical protein
MALDHVIPQAQARAFDRAVAERLGMNPAEIVDDFHVHFATDGEEMTRVEFRGTAWLPTAEVLAMFNQAARRA